jgi:hypothetical protein
MKQARAPRQCGDCTLCCKLAAVAEIGKAPGELCKHCEVGHGCRIYDSRPKACRAFECYFLINRSLREEWRPSKSRLVVIASPDRLRIGVHVDPDRPGAWKREPFYSTLKEWARAALSQPGRLGQVFVTIGQRTIVIFPDRNVDLGIVGMDEIVITEGKPGPKGIAFEAFKIPRSDPRASAILGEIEKEGQHPPIF